MYRASHLKADYKAVGSPPFYHRLEDLGNLIHFNDEGALARLNFVLRLDTGGPNLVRR